MLLEAGELVIDGGEVAVDDVVKQSWLHRFRMTTAAHPITSTSLPLWSVRYAQPSLGGLGIAFSGLTRS
jgi:hypothetical protein